LGVKITGTTVEISVYKGLGIGSSPKSCTPYTGSDYVVLKLYTHNSIISHGGTEGGNSGGLPELRKPPNFKQATLFLLRVPAPRVRDFFIAPHTRQ
jgi:hypothetical protein